MAIRVFVSRKVSDAKVDELRGYIDRLRNMTTGQPGYISGETLRRIDTPGEILVVSKWKTWKDWQRWFESQERAKVQQQIDALLGEPTDYSVFDFD